VFDLTAKRRFPTGCDRADDAALAAAKMRGVVAEIGVAMATENVGEFEHRRFHRRLLGRRHLQRQPIQRARRGPDQMRGHAGVARGRRQVLMAEQNLNESMVSQRPPGTP
jgi:hypothetical protein